jgi:hypothetical protein
MGDPIKFPPILKLTPFVGSASNRVVHKTSVHCPHAQEIEPNERWYIKDIPQDGNYTLCPGCFPEEAEEQAAAEDIAQSVGMRRMPGVADLPRVAGPSRVQAVAARGVVKIASAKTKPVKKPVAAAKGTTPRTATKPAGKKPQAPKGAAKPGVKKETPPKTTAKPAGKKPTAPQAAAKSVVKKAAPLKVAVKKPAAPKTKPAVKKPAPPKVSAKPSIKKPGTAKN